MTRPSAASFRAAILVIVASAALGACSSQGRMGVTRVKLSERECLARAMYFESNRSSDAGMLAVGTVVMNRVRSGKYGATVCEVVGAPRQFAPGVLTRSMSDSGAPRARRVADAVLSGRRHPGVQNAQFFHTAGYKFPYKNMRYVLVAGGNAFYDKTRAPKTWWGGEGRWGPPPSPTERIDGGPIMVANVEVEHDREPAVASRRTVVETETRVAAAPSRGGSVAGIPLYEPAPGVREREVQVASLEPSRQPRSRYEVAPRYEVGARRPTASRQQVAVREDVVERQEAGSRYEVGVRRPVSIREDNGLREEDRWRDQELAEDEGRKPAASDEEWRERRDATIESAPLPVIDAAPKPRPTRVASRRSRAVEAPVQAPEPAYEEPAPSRDVRMASRPTRIANVSTRPSRPVEANPAAMGWSVGPQPVRTAAEDSSYDAPLSRAAEQDGYMIDAPRKNAPATAAPRRSYGGVSLDGGDEVQYGYR